MVVLWQSTTIALPNVRRVPQRHHSRLPVPTQVAKISEVAANGRFRVEQTTRILLIEDDPAVAQSLLDGLNRNGFGTIWKSTGTEGVSYAREFNSHLVILDVRLPDGSGFDFCRHMRQYKMRHPIMMLTARKEEEDKILGLDIGADDYLTKPYSLSDLLAHVRALMRRAYGELAAVDSNVLYVGHLVIDRVADRYREETTC